MSIASQTFASYLFMPIKLGKIVNVDGNVAKLGRAG